MKHPAKLGKTKKLSRAERLHRAKEEVLTAVRRCERAGQPFNPTEPSRILLNAIDVLEREQRIRWGRGKYGWGYLIRR